MSQQKRDISNGWAAPADIEEARLLPKVRYRPKADRPAWVEARVKAMVESGEWA